MKILVISDRLSSTATINDVKILRWNDCLPTFFGTFAAVILDFSFITEDRLNEISANLTLIEENLKASKIDQDNLIVVVVCGSIKEEFILRSMGEVETKLNYDFLRDIIPEFNKRIEFLLSAETYFEPLSIKNISIRQYLELSNRYYLIFRYTADAESCSNLFPLAKTKKTSNACVAFEHRLGRGIAIILPGYDDTRSIDACMSLIRVCRNYFKVREECDDLELDISLPRNIKEYYSEGLICFLNDLYSSSCVSCGRALEGLLKILGTKGKTINQQLTWLKEKQLIHPKTEKVLADMKFLRNQGAHFQLDENEPVREEDALNMLQFFKRLIQDVYPLESAQEQILNLISKESEDE